MSERDEEIGATQKRSDQTGYLRTKTQVGPSANDVVDVAPKKKTGLATGADDRPVVKRPVDQKATREDILRKINDYNAIKPNALIARLDFLHAEHDPKTTDGLIGASTACIKVINGLIVNASDTVKLQTRDTRKALKNKINTYNQNKDKSDKLQSLDPDPETVGGKRKRSKKIGTKKKQYKRK